MTTNLQALFEEVTPVLQQHALDVDTGTFPSASLASLASAGLLAFGSSEEVGGRGGGASACAAVVRQVARSCGSTAMVTCMHFASAAVVEAFGDEATRRSMASGELLGTLAFSEAGSRSHFWAPLSTAERVGDHIRLDARKSWVTSASHADLVVWSSQPVEAEGASTLWLVRKGTEGIGVSGAFDGLGLRGNDSAPMRAEGARVTDAERLGADGGGFDIMMGVVLPRFNLMSAACSVGLAESALQASIAHCSATRFGHLDSSLRDLPTIRAYIARMQCKVAAASALLEQTGRAVDAGDEGAMLGVLTVKAVAAETALEVTELAMRVCGGAAFRKEAGVERAFRDARAANVMAPTTDVLFDFIGKAVTGMELF